MEGGRNTFVLLAFEVSDAKNDFEGEAPKTSLFGIFKCLLRMVIWVGVCALTMMT